MRSSEDSLVGPAPTPSQHRIALKILEQPTDTTCGPTALHAVYGYLGDEVPIDRVIAEVPELENGGTLAVHLGCHALTRGHRATIYTYNLQLFDPTWFLAPRRDLAERLLRQAEHKADPRLRLATQAYLEFDRLGGRVRFVELSAQLLQQILARDLPILTGLSATYLYRGMREIPRGDIPNDVQGEVVGHFVVLTGYDAVRRTVLVSDPYGKNPLSPRRQYHIGIDRVIGAILLGALTYDANLLIIESRRPRVRVPPLP